MWEINLTPQFEEWYMHLSEADTARVNSAVAALEERGPSLARPLADSIAGSRIHNLKELRAPSSTIRILFAFDPRREAILLLGADKAKHGMNAWYQRAIPEAERLYDEYLDELREEGLIT